jgi:hypothetical protein
MLVRFGLALALVASVAHGQTLGLPAAGEPTPCVPGAQRLYEDARQAPTPLPAKLLVCRVRAKGLWDSAFLLSSEADLRVGLSVGQRPPVWVDGPEDADVAFVTFPVSVAAGDALRFNVWDRDVLEHQVVGNFDVTVGSELPVELDAADASITCFGVSDAQSGPERDARLAQLDEALKALANPPPPRLREPGLGLGSELSDLRRALFAAAAWTGWGGEAMKPRLERAQALERAWYQRVAQAVDAEVGDGAVAGTITCERRSCRLLLPVASTTFPPRAELLLSSGQLLELHSQPVRDQPGVVVFNTPSSGVDPWVHGTARLLRLQTRGVVTLQRLPAGLTALNGPENTFDLANLSKNQKVLLGVGIGTAVLGVGVALGAWFDRDGTFGRVCAITAGTLGMATLGAGLGALLFGGARDEFMADLAGVLGGVIGGSIGLVLGGVASPFLSEPRGEPRAVLGVAGGGVMLVVPLTVLLIALR